MKAFIVVNPVSGQLTLEDKCRQINAHVERQGWDSEIYTTTGNEDLPVVVSTALEAGYNLVVAAGGDGTVSSVGSALIHTQVPLGILPSGTANVLAREVGIPVNIAQALEVLSNPNQRRSLDAMQIGDKYFLLNIGIGFSSVTMNDVSRAEKRRWGILAYVWKGLRQLIGIQPYRFLLTFEDYHGWHRASEVHIANSSLVGLRPFRLDQEIRLDDGKLGVCIVKGRTLGNYIRIAIDMLLARQESNPYLRCWNTTQWVGVRAEPPLPVQADGELIGYTPLEVRVVPHALQLIVPEILPTDSLSERDG